MRYHVHGRLGRGGTASVEEAVEVSTGRRVALKRLQPQADPVKQQRHAELFEREYHTLSQLAHPRIVGVYDYGVDASGAYFTMELLDGGDLQEIAPLPWRGACAIARDIASALSLLHSRRLVHRDVSPRNVRRTREGYAKLIDFGAVAPMGPSRIVVGTPPCCAPENVHLQALDGRTDLFALGATLYYMLCGRHAYAARHFSQLNDAWQAGFARPSELTAGVPEALDTLVLDLLRLEPEARPANAAEVIERLCAIDGELPAEQLQVARAYLAMPTLVGRQTQLARLHRKLKRATHARGRTVLIEGAAGVGRSRFLDAAVLDGALLGAVCARADAEDASLGAYGVLRALMRRLITVSPAAIEAISPQDRPLLAALLPELGSQPSAVERPKLQAACVRWFKAVCGRTPLLLGVDDAHRIDEASAAVLSLLAHEAPHHLALVLTAELDARWISWPAQKLMRQDAARFELAPLGRDETEKLLISLFGEVPNIRVLAARMFEVTLGHPRDVLGLAQHLVTRGIARYEAGAWSLPANIDQDELPSDLVSALAARVAALPETARTLGIALALCPDQSFDARECARLCAPRTAAAWMRDVAELLITEIALWIDDRLRLLRPQWIAPLRAGATPELERELQLRLAAVLEARGEDFRAGQQLFRAGERERALDLLVAHARRSVEETARSSDVFTHYAQSLPADWLETYDCAIRACEELGRPARDAFELRARMSGLVPAFAADDRGHVAALLAQLKQLSGLSDWEAVDPTLPQHARIGRALQLAEARHASAGPTARVIAPAEALNVLGRALSAAMSRVSLGVDLPYLRSLPSLEPFAPVSPSAAVLNALVQAIAERYIGRSERARELYGEVLERISQPDRSGLDASYAEFIRLALMNGLGMMEASMGLRSSLYWADRTAAHPLYLRHALQTRMLYHLYQGNVHAAEDCRREVERLRLQSVQLYETSHLYWEFGAYVIAEDLTRLRHAIEAMAPLTSRYPPWKFVQHYAGAEYHRIRRDPARALAALEPALGAQPEDHPLWVSIATTHVRSLDDLGRHDEARAAVERYVQAAARLGLAHHAEPLRQAHALCLARAGDREAERIANEVIGRYAALGVRGLLLGAAYETRARVALLLKDEAAFNDHADACRDVYTTHRNSALLAKYKRLRQEGERRAAPPSQRLAATPDSYGNFTGMRMVGALEFCRGSDARARLALTILVRNSGARAGFMFTFGAHGPECIGSVGGLAMPESILPRVLRYLARNSEVAPTTSTGTREDTDPDSGVWTDDDGHSYRPVLLSHNPGAGTAVSGVALLVLAPDADFRYPTEIAAAISRFYSECGDTSMLMLTD